jgi:isocitrate dehydrogenase
MKGMIGSSPITVARGDGIGPEIMDATLRILEAAGARLDYRGRRDRRAGLPVGQHRGHRARRPGTRSAAPGLPEGPDHHAAGRRLQEPQRHHAQDARPVRQRAALRQPTTRSSHEAPGHGRRHRPRERGGHLRGIEHQQTAEVTQCLKLITRPGCEDHPLRLRVRPRQRPEESYLLHQGQHHEADGRALPQGSSMRSPRSTRTSRTSTDHRHRRRPLADRPRALRRHRHPEPLRRHHLRHRRADRRLGRPRRLANIGEHCAMFEAIHGSAPDIAGQGTSPTPRASPGGVMMLVHLGQTEVAERSTTPGSAPSRTASTPPTSTRGFSEQAGRHQEFADAVIEHLGQEPEKLHPVHYASRAGFHESPRPKRPPQEKASSSAWTCSSTGTSGPQPRRARRESSPPQRRTARPRDDHQPRREGVARGHARDLLHRPLALPLHE